MNNQLSLPGRRQLSSYKGSALGEPMGDYIAPDMPNAHCPSRF